MILNTTSFITTPEFKKLAKIFFDARMTEKVQILPSKIEVDATLDRADKNREKN